MGSLAQKRNAVVRLLVLLFGLGLASLTGSVALGSFFHNLNAHSSTWDSPAILSTAPGNEAGVALDATVVITFSKTISRGTFVYTVIPDPGGWAAMWNDDGTVVILDHNLFSYATAYAFIVTAADDLMGNILEDAPYEWGFGTEMPEPFPEWWVYLPLVLR